MSQPAKRRHWAAQLMRTTVDLSVLLSACRYFAAFADWYTVPTGSSCQQ